MRVSIVFLLGLALSGCAAERLNRDGLDLISEGRYEEGVAKLEQATKSEPSNLHYRAEFFTKRDEVINRLLISADQERDAEHFEEAGRLYRRVLTINPSNVRAAAGLTTLAQDQRHLALLDDARILFEKSDIDGAWAKLRTVATENPANPKMLALRREIEEKQAKEAFATPTLKSLYKKPVSLEFRDANLKMVFDVLSRTSGINFIFDKNVRSDLTTTIFVKRASLEDVVDLLLTTNQLEKKVLNSNSVLIFPNTPDKVKEYQDLLVKSFYLENADVKQTMNLVKTLLKSREIFVDEKLNLMIMRDTPDTIKLAEKLIAMHDLAEPEVMLEVEVLEVKRTRLLDLGIKYPEQLTLAPLAAAGGTTVTLNDLKTINASKIGASMTNVSINAKKDDSDVNLLANPRIRTRNREKAKIMIGDRVPVITTTSTSTGFVSDSVQYVDVGLKLEVEPNIYLKDDVAIKVSLEVSSIVNQIASKNGTLTYQIGSRNASTVLRLKDGETQVLAGLINDEDRSTANKLPGMGDLPVLGRLFSTHRDDKQKTEIVLSITPHLIRRLERPRAIASEFWSGSEVNLRAAPLTLRQSKPAEVNSGSQQPAEKAGEPVSLGGDKPTQGMESQTAVGLTWEGPKEIKRGESFQLKLKLKANGGLRGLPFQVAYDPAALKVADVAEGDFFKQDNNQTSFASNVDADSGKIFAGVTRSGPDGAAGERNLSTITFQALADTPKTEVKLLAATPVGVGNQVFTPLLPEAFAIMIVR
jgi:general secretion pathway protein D